MKSILLLLLIIFIPYLSISQTDKVYEFAGTLELSTKEIITFKLTFKELNDGKIEGSSLTDIYGIDRTKSTINGNVDWKNKKISFSENINLDTKSSADPSTFCYVHVSNAKIKTTNGKSIIQGNFSGKFGNGKQCINGTIYLIGLDYLSELAKKYLPNYSITDIDSILTAKANNKDAPVKIGGTILKNNEVLKLNWSSQEIVIDVWDSRYNDGDEIAIYVNDKKVLDKFVMSTEKKTIVIPFNEKKGSIRIQALKEGTMRYCTANLTLRDGEKNSEVISYLKKNENAIVVLNRK
jgi:hypothetical protein